MGRVLRLAPDFAGGHNSLGWVLMTTGDTDQDEDKAIAQFKLAVKLKSDFVHAHSNLASVLASKK